MVWCLKLLFVFLFYWVVFLHSFLHLIFFSFQPLCIALDVSVLNAVKPLQIVTKKYLNSSCSRIKFML